MYYLSASGDLNATITSEQAATLASEDDISTVIPTMFTSPPVKTTTPDPIKEIFIKICQSTMQDIDEGHEYDESDIKCFCEHHCSHLPTTEKEMQHVIKIIYAMHDQFRDIPFHRKMPELKGKLCIQYGHSKGLHEKYNMTSYDYYRWCARVYLPYGFANWMTDWFPWLKTTLDQFKDLWEKPVRLAIIVLSIAPMTLGLIGKNTVIIHSRSKFLFQFMCLQLIAQLLCCLIQLHHT